MNALFLGHDRATRQPVHLPTTAFRTHLHLPGATGKGKTTAILTMLHQLLLSRREPAFHLIVDFLGGLSWDLLLWMASRYCTQQVRDRLVYIQPSSQEVVMGINPLSYEDADSGYYRVSRASEQILRAWESQNAEAMPRLARWLGNSFWAGAELGLTIADTAHLVMPGSPYHRALLERLSPLLQAEWREVLEARSAEASRILESTRNRLKPFYASNILRNMFGSTQNRFDVQRFMRDRKIVVLNLAPLNRLAPQEQDAIAGLAVNEVLATARSLPPTERHPTFLWLDEFQRMIGPDFEYAIPEVRQLDIRLILAHQSFSQLERGDTDLTSIIWQPQTRLAFGNQGEDADILAHEFAAIAFDPRRIKDEIYSLRQLQTGHRVVQLDSWGTSEADSRQWGESLGRGTSDSAATARRDGSHQRTRTDAAGRSSQHSTSTGGSQTRSTSRQTHQQLVANLETILERASTTYTTFDEQRSEWAREVRKLTTGACVLRTVDDAALRVVDIVASRPGHLAFDRETLHRRFPEAIDAVEALIERNFAQADFFVTRAVIECETRERMERILRPVIEVRSTLPPPSSPSPSDAPFPS